MVPPIASQAGLGTDVRPSIRCRDSRRDLGKSARYGMIIPSPVTRVQKRAVPMAETRGTHAATDPTGD